jgi:hypothetical protein
MIQMELLEMRRLVNVYLRDNVGNATVENFDAFVQELVDVALLAKTKLEPAAS